MKNKFITLSLFTLLFSFSSLSLANDVNAAIDKFKASPQLTKFFNNSYGYAIFPNIGKGGFGLGGAYGEGSVFKKGQKTGTSSMIQVTLGFQLGGQAFSEIIFFQNEKSYQDFTSGNFEFSAQASAVAITAAANAKTSTTGMAAGAGEKSQTGKYQNGMAAFTYIKGGLMYEAALGGQKFSFEKL
jgi:lipid-binding SYLF domain-containing protein